MVLLFLAYGLLASAISTNKILLYALAPEFLVGIRMTVASLLLALYGLFYAHHRLDSNRIKAYVGPLIIIALFTTYFPSNLKAYALAHMPSSKMTFFGTLDPFVTALYSYILYKEQLTLKKWVGMAIGFLGMMVLLSSKSDQLMTFSQTLLPELAAFGAVVLGRFGWILAQQFLKKGLFGPVPINSVTMFIGGTVSLVGAYLRSQMGVIPLSNAPLPLLQKVPLNFLSPGSQLLLFLGYTIIVGNMLGYTLYAYALKHYSATFIALAGVSVPLFVHFFGWLFLQEPLSMTFFLSCLITFTGLMIFFFDEKRN